MDAPIRIRVKFAGHVQGVGFRYTTVGVARRFDVKGYVLNLPDGCVELVTEGRPDEARAFIAAVAEEMSGCISDTKSHEEPTTGEFTGFRVRH